MGTTILRSRFTTRVDAILQGINTDQHTTANRLLALDSMLARYSQDKPKLRTIDMAGDGGNYYVLYGQTTKVLNSTQDATIDLLSSGSSDRQLAVSFTLPYRMTIHAIRLLLKRIDTGALAGTVACEIRLPGSSVPTTIIAQTSASLALNAADIPLGYEAGKTEFVFTSPTPLDAGTYYAALVPAGYTYSDGVTEIALGVDQSSVTNTLFTFDGTSTWTAFGTDSAVIVEVIASLPGWQYRWSYFKGADIPAPTISDNEVPRPLEDEDIHQANVEETEYIYFPNNAPSLSEVIRLSYASKYGFAGTPFATDIPEAHFEAVSQLGAYYICLNLAAGYGQNIDSGHSFDVSDRRSQSDIYASRAKGFLNSYAAMLGITLAEDGGDTAAVAAMSIGDMDRGSYSPREPLFHNRWRR